MIIAYKVAEISKKWLMNAWSIKILSKNSSDLTNVEYKLLSNTGNCNVSKE